MTHTRRTATVLAAFVGVLVVGVVGSDVARADPATPASYPAASSATRVQGRFFDTCTAPQLAALTAWRGDLSVHRSQHLLRWTEPRVCAA